MKYVLMTAVRNEENYVGKTIQAVLSQTVLPERWVIVSDGSADQTDAIVISHVREHPFMEFVRREAPPRRSFASKAHALALSYRQLRRAEYDFIGNLDADVSFGERYYESMLVRFAENQRLGLAGGFIHEKSRGKFIGRASNSTRSVAGAIQLFRRDCFEAIGGYLPMDKGGEDWAAEVMARMKGWEVEAFPEIPVCHYKASGVVSMEALRRKFRDGTRDQVFGSHPLFEVARCMRRIKEKPYLLGAAVRMCGFVWSACQREGRTVPEDLVKYLRHEQLQRMRLPLQILRVSFAGILNCKAIH
jgi:glycosyltransferase involved in cell wall biosynthesis